MYSIFTQPNHYLWDQTFHKLHYNQKLTEMSCRIAIIFIFILICFCISMAGTLYIIQPMATNKNHECSINGYLYDPSFKYKQINCFLTYLVINTIIVSVKVDMAAINLPIIFSLLSFNNGLVVMSRKCLQNYTTKQLACYLIMLYMTRFEGFSRFSHTYI